MAIKQFLDAVTSQIRSKEAKSYVNAEISQHVANAKKAWMKKGLNESEAEAKAVQEMGSPVTLGQSLNQLHKPKTDWLLVTLFISILLLSFLPIFALNSPSYDNPYGINIRSKIIHILLGIIVAIGFMFIDYRKFARWGYAFYAAGVLFVAFLYVFSNSQVNGEPMFNIGPITLQVWLALPLFCIAWAALFSKENFRLWQAIVLGVFPLIIFSVIPNLSVLFIYSVMTFVLFLQSKFSWKQKRAIIVLVVATIICFISFMVVSYKKGFIADYQLARLWGYLHPEQYTDTGGYVYVQLQELLNNVGLFGTETTVYLPEPHTDLVFAQLLQSYGYAMGLFIIILLTFFIVRMCKISFIAKNPFGKLLIIGGVTLFVTQFLYSVGMTVGIFPLISIPLPFISYGLMPTVLNAFIIGIGLSVYRRKNFSQFRNRNEFN